MDEALLDRRTKIFTNATLLAAYLVLASHFAAPSLLAFFGLSLGNIPVHIASLVKLVAPAVIELNPWYLILALVPHFLFGFDVETAAGSLRYAAAVLASATLTNVFTLLGAILFNTVGLSVLPRDYIFASSTPVILLCVLGFVLLVPTPVADIGPVSLWVCLAAAVVRCVGAPLVHVINLIVALIIDFFVIRWLDASLTVAECVRAVVPRRVQDVVDAKGDSEGGRQRAIRTLAKSSDEVRPLTQARPCA
jgi:hypothetical protein